MTYRETDVVEVIDRLLNEHRVDPSDEGSLDNLDQFHIGGAEAVDRLIATLALTDGDVVLDVGCGFGGPARQIARRTGNHVLGIDITPAYIDAARNLTAKAHLSSRVHFDVADLAAFRPGTRFNAAISMHVEMNVPDKTSWFKQIGGLLLPGGRLGIWEVCATRGRELPWPMPWSLDGGDSFVVDADSLRDSVESAGFSTVEWTNETPWVRDWIDDNLGSGLPAGPALPMLLDEGYQRVVNFLATIADGTLEIWRGSFTKDTD